MLVTPLYAVPLALLFIVLSLRTLRLRRRLKIPVGDGGNEQMLRAMRVHANFAEYVPLTLLLIYLFEAGGGPAGLVHALCAGLIIGRLSHARGVSRIREDYRYRVLGMAMTLTALGVAALGVLVQYGWRLLA